MKAVLLRCLVAVLVLALGEVRGQCGDNGKLCGADTCCYGADTTCCERYNGDMGCCGLANVSSVNSDG